MADENLPRPSSVPQEVPLFHSSSESDGKANMVQPKRRRKQEIKMCPVSGLSVIGVFLALIVVFISYYKWKFQYWKRKNLPYKEPKIPFGNTPNMLIRKKPMQEDAYDIYKYFKKKGLKHGGFYLFSQPVYFPVDLDYVKNILTKDFSYFTDRGMYYDEKNDPLSAHLFAIGGAKSKSMRTKLSPTFSTGKMKAMFGILNECGAIFKNMMDSAVDKKKPLDIRDLTGRFTTDVIGSCAFGLECKTITDDQSPFRKYGKTIFQPGTARFFLIGLLMVFPSLRKLLGVKSLRRDTNEFFMKVVKDTVEYREKNDYRRNDFLQILIDLKNNKLDDEIVGEHDGKSLTIEQIAAQCLVFYVGGFETSSTLMAFTMLELCKHPELQEKLREEVKSVLKKYNGEITYDGIMEMKYMRQVLDETMRMHPPFGFMSRKCVKDYKVPDTDLIIEKDTRVWISILGIHHDEEYYPNPEVFDPDRFSEESKGTRHPYSFVPFGEGPRICIRLRFGYMQAKVGLTILLKNYRFTLDPNMKLPVEMDPSSIVSTVKGGVWLRAERI